MPPWFTTKYQQHCCKCTPGNRSTAREAKGILESHPHDIARLTKLHSAIIIWYLPLPLPPCEDNEVKNEAVSEPEVVEAAAVVRQPVRETSDPALCLDNIADMHQRWKEMEASVLS